MSLTFTFAGLPHFVFSCSALYMFLSECSFFFDLVYAVTSLQIRPGQIRSSVGGPWSATLGLSCRCPLMILSRPPPAAFVELQ